MSVDLDLAHWVYRMFDAEGRLLYVGMTSNPEARLQVWRSTGRTNGHWFPQVSNVRWEFHGSKADAAAAERRAIFSESPQHNINMASPMRSRQHRPERTERAARMLHAYVDDDMTLEQIGKRHGVTRERVRQVLNEHDRTVYMLAQGRRRARTRHRRWINAGGVAHRVICRVCGETFETTDHRVVFCSPIHRQVWNLFRYQVDDEYRSQVRVNIAKWNLRNSEDHVVLRHANRVVAGEVEADRRRRFLQFGSLSWHWAVRACALGWPLFDLLHEDVQDQVRRQAEVPAMSKPLALMGVA